MLVGCHSELEPLTILRKQLIAIIDLVMILLALFKRMDRHVEKCDNGDFYHIEY